LRARPRVPSSGQTQPGPRDAIQLSDLLPAHLYLRRIVDRGLDPELGRDVWILSGERALALLDAGLGRYEVKPRDVRSAVG
jgi:hypothetical protein